MLSNAAAKSEKELRPDRGVKRDSPGVPKKGWGSAPGPVRIGARSHRPEAPRRRQDAALHATRSGVRRCVSRRCALPYLRKSLESRDSPCRITAIMEKAESRSCEPQRAAADPVTRRAAGPIPSHRRMFRSQAESADAFMRSHRHHLRPVSRRSIRHLPQLQRAVP